MPSRSEDRANHAAQCRVCKRYFMYKATLPKQDICRECFYESRGDLTGSLQEKEWHAAFDAGFAKAEEVYYKDAEREGLRHVG